MSKYPQFNPEVVKKLSKDQFIKNLSHHKDDFDLGEVWDFHNPKQKGKKPEPDTIIEAE